MYTQFPITKYKHTNYYFISLGLDKNRVSFIGYGNERPIDTNKTKSGRDKNRRVEFKIIGK
ncbi:OmpA family protein [uncultured Flavobacterium sp.]|uniref:OmpA family protein n=1 Tax=uncultured Flavobacterium sp. TaxID=165435 RepID=UPI00345D18E3